MDRKNCERCLVSWGLLVHWAPFEQFRKHIYSLKLTIILADFWGLLQRGYRVSLATHFLTMLFVKSTFWNKALSFIFKKWFFKAKNFTNHAFFFLQNTKFGFRFFKMCFLSFKWDSKRALCFSMFRGRIWRNLICGLKCTKDLKKFMAPHFSHKSLHTLND